MVCRAGLCRNVARFIGSAQSANPNSQEAKQLNEAYYDFLASTTPDEVVVLYEGVARDIDPNGPWKWARQRHFDVGHLLWLAQQENQLSGKPEIRGSEPPMLDKLRTLTDKEGGFGYDPMQVTLYFLAGLEIRGFLGRRSQDALPDSVTTFEDYFNRRLNEGTYHKVYPEIMDQNGPFARYANYEVLEEAWSRIFPGISLDPLLPWPEGDGPFNLGRERTSADYRLLLHGINTGNPTTDAKIPGNVLRRVSNDDILIRDEYKLYLIENILRDGRKIFTVQGSRHFRSLVRALLHRTSNNPGNNLYFARDM